MNGYSNGKPRKVHWAWSLVGMALAMLVLSLAGAWIAEGLAL